ncbi:MAG: helix-turn-helix domain-containing protein [Pirellulales bacterium]
MSIRNTYVKVQEASEILGVAPNTIRSWGATGKIPEHRHPANGYRLYKRSDLEHVIRQIEESAVATVARPRKPIRSKTAAR